MIKSLTISLIMLTLTHSIHAQEEFKVGDYMNYLKYDSSNKEIINGQSWPEVVFMGNSITENWVEMRPDFFESNNFIGRGISGQVSHQMLLRFQSEVVMLKPKVVVILAGTNDLAQNSGPVTIDQIMSNIKSMVDIASVNSIQPVLCSVLPAIAFPWRPGIEPASMIRDLNYRIAQFAKDKGLIYIDYYQRMVDDKGGLKVPDFTTADDLVHPNVEGYALMEEVVLPALKALLDQ